MKTKKNLKNNQSGIASMVIVILIMTLLTLIVVSMTQNSNREQRQALDRQLNSQALYAAESGINDAKDYVVDNPLSAPAKKTDCKPTSDANQPAGEYFKGKKAQVGEDAVIKYSCVLYNRQPKEIILDNVDTDSPDIMPIEHENGQPISSLKISWKKKGGGSGDVTTGQTNVHVFDTCHSTAQKLVLPSAWPAECDAGILRVELMDPLAGNRQAFLSEIYTAYLKPANNELSGEDTYTNGKGIINQGALVNGICNNFDDCEFTITNINKPKLYLNVRSLYMPNSVEISGITTTGIPVEFVNAQMSVDSTGRANDILKRVSVRVPLSGLVGSLTPPFVIQTSTDLCKQLQLRPGQPTPVIDQC